MFAAIVYPNSYADVTVSKRCSSAAMKEALYTTAIAMRLCFLEPNVDGTTRLGRKLAKRVAIEVVAIGTRPSEV